jgi:predicted branched-subunit amino acid permease
MQHMQKLPARPDCHNHLFILSSSFTACANNPKMQKVLQASLVTDMAHAPCHAHQAKSESSGMAWIFTAAVSSHVHVDVRL